MKFYCDQCHAQYFIADEKIGSKGVKVRCKRCDNVIIIRPPAADEKPADEAPAASDDPLGGLGGDAEELDAPAASGASSDSGLGDLDLDLGLNEGDNAGGAGLQASSTGGNGDDDLLAGVDDDLDGGAESSTVTESAGAPAVAVAAPARRAPANVTAGGGLGEDALDSELAGAFDSVFGAAPVDPFNTVEITGAPDRSKRETRFYNPQEMAQVAQEKMAAQDDDDLVPAASATSAPGFGLKPGGNGAGDDGDDLLAGAAAEAPPADDLDRDPVWYVAVNEQQVGPISLADLGERWDRREVDGDSLIWKSSLSDWMPVRDVAELRAFVASKSASRRDPLSGGATEVERPRSPVGLAPFDAAAALDTQSILGNISMPTDTMNDPFATVESIDIPQPGGVASGSWRPHGMTEIYQAASLAEASSQQPMSLPEQPIEDEVDWNPGAAAALASLVDDEIKSVAAKPSGGFMQTADDGDLQLAPEGKSNYGDLLSNAPLPTPRQSGSSLPLADPFAAQISATGVGDVDIAQIAGQSSMVMQRPSYLSEPPKTARKINWLLWGGIGGGSLLMVVILVILVVLLVKVLSPAQPPVVAVAAGSNNPPGPPGTPGQPGGNGQMNNPGLPANPSDTPGTPASQPRAADQLPTTPSPPIGVEEPTEQDRRKGKAPAIKKSPGIWNKTGTAKPALGEGDPGSTAPEPKAVEPKPTPAPAGKSGACDPILFPDGICPKGTEGGPTPTAIGNTLTKSQILMTVKKNMPAIKACSAEQAKRDKRLATGDLKMSWYVRADGKTKNVTIMTAKFKSTYVGTCVVDSISKWQFPAFEGEDVGPIKFPFTLE